MKIGVSHVLLKISWRKTRGAPGELDVLRAPYVVSDILAHRGHDPPVVGVLDNERRHLDCRKQRSHVQLRNHRQHESKGPWARGQPFIPCPSCPDFFVPRHIRICRMCEFPMSVEQVYRFWDR